MALTDTVVILALKASSIQTPPISMTLRFWTLREAAAYTAQVGLVLVLVIGGNAPSGALGLGSGQVLQGFEHGHRSRKPAGPTAGPLLALQELRPVGVNLRSELHLGTTIASSAG